MNKCEHEPCHCRGDEVGADGYCSQNCREEKMEAAKCACGHADCQ